jgi:hypothetical protein
VTCFGCVSIGDYHDHLTAAEQWGVDLALETVLDLQ